MAGYPKPTRYKVKNISKYIGDVNNVIMRSSWERKFSKYCDTTPYIVKWGSEPFAVPYISPLDGKPHRYFPDFVVVAKHNDKLITTVIEVKPHVQTLPPKAKKKRTASLLKEQATYAVNQAKWEAAEEYCKRKGWRFVIATEKELKV